MTVPKPNPVTRGNLLNISDKIKELHSSFPHSQMLNQLLQKAVQQMENGSTESLKLIELLKEIDFKGISAFSEEVFVRVQKQALEVIAGVIGSEMERPI